MRRVLNSKFRHGVLSILAMTAVSVTFAAGAQAQEILSGGALFGGVNQSRAVCYVYNSGDSNLELTGFQITAPDGIAVSPFRNECGPDGATLPAGRPCGIAANVGNITSYNCRVVVSPDKVSTRGVFEMRNSRNGASLTNVELR